MRHGPPSLTLQATPFSLMIALDRSRVARCYRGAGGCGTASAGGYIMSTGN